MEPIFGYHLMEAAQKDADIVKTLEEDSARNEHVYRSFCNTLSFSASTLMRDPVTPASLAKFDKILARHLANRLRSMKLSLHHERDADKIESIESDLEANEWFGERMDEIISETNDMDGDTKTKVAWQMLVRNLGVPAELAATCLKEKWTVGRLMINYPKFFVRGFTPEILKQIY